MTDWDVTQWCEANGVVLRYRRVGSGPLSFVLVHEMGGTLESWEDVVPSLAGHGQVLCYDVRGCGLSQKLRGAVEIETLTADIAALVSSLGFAEPVVVAGCAVGGAIALQFAADYPDRCAGVVAMAPAVGVPPERREALLGLAEKIEAFGAGMNIDQRLAGGYPVELRTDRARFEQLRARRIAADPFGIAAQMRMLAELDMKVALRRIECPVRLVAGSFDGDRPPHLTSALAHDLRDASFVTLPTGHFMSVQTPELVADELLSFARTVRGSKPHL